MKGFEFSPSGIIFPVIALLIPLTVFSGCSSSTGANNEDREPTLSALALLGRQLYFDENLSNPVGQSCASCHLPSAGFADPDSGFPVSQGAVTGRFGARNAPSAGYAAFIPPFSFVLDAGGGGHYRGGQFLDGRASSLELQAQGPFLNPLEMNMADEDAVIQQLRDAVYVGQFTGQFGANSLNDVAEAYQQIALAIAEFERSAFFAPFNSKFDAVRARDDVFTVAEENGRNLFNGKADCRRCHNSGPGSRQIFSDFEYHNIGVPKNNSNPFLTLPLALNPAGNAFVDNGLGGVLSETAQNGKFRTPTLRNTALTAPYMHNGVFDTLTQVVEFYNRRDVDGVTAEVAQNVDNGGNIGNLNLSADEVRDLVAFLQTLSDR